MSTVVLNAYSKPYPLITNRIRATVATQTSPNTVIASIIDTTTGHPQRVWSFPGLPRANYSFSLDEINGAGVVVNNLALFAVVPGEADGMTIRDDEQIIVGVTYGFNIAATAALFNGDEVTSGDPTTKKPDYRNWEIVPSELEGRGILKEGLDYSWDKITGQFSLLQTGDQLQQGTYYNIHFNPILNPSGNSVPIAPFDTRYISVSTTVDAVDFGKVVIIEPTGNYIEITLPLLSAVSSNVPMKVEVTNSTVSIGTVKCVKFKTSGSDIIKFLRGNLYALCGESFEIYKFENPTTAQSEWRIKNAVGNFSRVGQYVSDDMYEYQALNRVCVTGVTSTIGDVLQHARLYNDVILNLSSVSVVNFDDWITGDNKRYFSLANSANPTYAGKFRFPDRGDLFEMNCYSGDSGDYLPSRNKIHGHTIKTTASPLSSSNSADPVRGSAAGNNNSRGVADDIGSGNSTLSSSGEATARPETVMVNRFVLL